jgi:hypothetical protein
VLYLAGELDEDRAVATSKGFSHANMIAIEHDAEVAKRLRLSGTLTLVGDAFDHVFAWNPSRRIDVVVLDLCNGFTQKAVENIETMIALPHLQDAVIAVNMLRGRDASGNKLRDAITEAQRQWMQMSFGFESKAVRLGFVSADIFGHTMANFLGGEPFKHRGSLLQALLIRNWAWTCLLAFDAIDESLQPKANNEAASKEAGRRAVAAVTRARFQTLSYRSTACQTFDTLVFRNSLASQQIIIAPEATAAACNVAGLIRLRQQQAAILAHRTRRLGRP